MAIRSVTSDVGNKKVGEGYFVATAEALSPFPNTLFFAFRGRGVKTGALYSIQQYGTLIILFITLNLN